MVDHLSHFAGLAVGGVLLAVIITFTAVGLHFHAERTLRTADAAAAAAAASSIAAHDAAEFRRGATAVVAVAIFVAGFAVASVYAYLYYPPAQSTTRTSTPCEPPKKAPITAPTPCCCHDHDAVAAAETVPCKEAP